MENTADANKGSNDLQLQLQWVKPVEEIHFTGSFEDIKRKLIRNPLVPIGAIATATVLGMGFKSLLRGNRARSQIMMRWRVGLQICTIGVLVAGIYYENYLQSKEKKCE